MENRKTALQLAFARKLRKLQINFSQFNQSLTIDHKGFNHLLFYFPIEEGIQYVKVIANRDFSISYMFPVNTPVKLLLKLLEFNLIEQSEVFKLKRVIKQYELPFNWFISHPIVPTKP